VNVRPYADDDERACRALFAELVETHRRLYPGAQIGETFEREGEGFVVEDAARVVGYAGLLWHGRVAELEPIVVAPSHRGRRAGRLLAAHVVEVARERGAIRVVVRPVGWNLDAIAFFHSVGFDVLGRLELQYELEPRERRDGPLLGGKAFRV
jgi:ribosomal protein S18 acetylase RimI-like enzyme